MRCLLLQTVAAALLSATRVSGEANDTAFDPLTTYCRRWGHSSAVLGERLYIDGGELNIVGEGAKNFTNTRLLYHDLTTTFKNGSRVNMPVMWANLSKPSTVPNVRNGNLWPDVANAYLYQYGGEYPDGMDPPSGTDVWQYDVYNNNWTSLPNTESDLLRVSYAASTAVEFMGISYMLGGWLNNRTMAEWGKKPEALNTLAQYEFTTNTWTNSSRPEDGYGRAEGSMLFVPTGDNGLLVHFGGVWVEEGKTSAAPMESIDVYDMAGAKWYQQNATGDIPKARGQFGAALISADDKSSHNIYVYGGKGYGNNTGFDDIYILSLPSFRWIKVYEGTNLKYGPTADAVNNQILLIGGELAKDPEVTTCDGVPLGAGAHNLRPSNDESWWSSYTVNKTAYNVPEEITNVIGGTKTGGANLTEPKHGWVSSDLEILFSRTLTITPRAATRTPPSNPDDHHSSTNIPAIVAPTVIVGTLLLAGLGGFFLLRRYRKRAYSSYQKPPGQDEAAVVGPYTVGTENRWSATDGGIHSPVSPYMPGGAGVPPQYELHGSGKLDAKAELPAANTEPVELAGDESVLPRRAGTGSIIGDGGSARGSRGRFQEHGMDD